MGIVYYGVCHDCKKSVYLDKFYWGAAAVSCGRDGENVRDGYLAWFSPEDPPYHDFRPWLLLAFIGRHGGHRIEFLIEDSYYDLDDYTEEWPDAWNFPRVSK